MDVQKKMKNKIGNNQTTEKYNKRDPKRGLKP